MDHVDKSDHLFFESLAFVAREWRRRGILRESFRGSGDRTVPGTGAPVAVALQYCGLSLYRALFSSGMDTFARAWSAEKSRVLRLWMKSLGR